MQKVQLFVLTILAAVSFSGCSQNSSKSSEINGPDLESGKSQKKPASIAEEPTRIFENAEVVSVYSLFPYGLAQVDHEQYNVSESDKKLFALNGDLGGYPIYGKVDIGELDKRREVAELISKSLSNEGNDDKNMISPRYAVVLSKNNSEITVILAFLSNKWTLHSADHRYYERQFTGKALINNAEQVLRALLKEGGVKIES